MTAFICRFTRGSVAITLLCAILFTRPVLADGAAMAKLGVCLGSDPLAERDAIIASGAKWVRMAPEWGWIETSQNVYNTTYLTQLDTAVNDLAARGVNILWVLCYTAPWASSQPSSPDASRYKPANLADWTDFVDTIVRRYDGKISCWEVWNEPDHQGAWKNGVQDYVDLLQAAATTIRAVNPSNKVLMGGLATTTDGLTDSYGPGTFFDQMMDLGADGSFDIVNYHSYGGSPKAIARYNGMAAVINQHGIQSKKIWVTETGYTTVGDTAKEAAKADQVDQAYTTLFDLPNVERVFWYVHRNRVVAGNPSESNFGLCANDLTPLKALYFYQGTNGAQTDFKLQKDYPSSANRRTLNYFPATSGDGSHVVDYAADGSTKRIPATRYMYLRIDDNWLFDANDGLDTTAYIDVTYLDNGTGNWSLQYDAQSNAYLNSNKARTNTGAWLTTRFTLSDVKFANRQNNAADFRLYAGGSDLVVSKVVVSKEMTMARMILGATDRFCLMERPDSTTTTHEAYNPVAAMGGSSCRQILDNNKYMYFRVCDGLIRAGDPQVTFVLTFWDAGTDAIRLQYAGADNTIKTVNITKTATSQWRTVQVTVNDASFTNTLNYSGDFRVSNANDGSVEYMRAVEVRARP